MRSCKSCELMIPSFINWYPVSLTLQLHSNWGWNRDYKVKLGPKVRVNFLKIIFLICQKLQQYLNKKNTAPEPWVWSFWGWDSKRTCKRVDENSTGDETQKTINFGGKLSFILSLLFPERLHCCYIYFHCSSWLYYIISLEPCALNAEYLILSLQQFILRFIIMSLLCSDTSEREDRGVRGGPKDRKRGLLYG